MPSSSCAIAICAPSRITSHDACAHSRKTGIAAMPDCSAPARDTPICRRVKAHSTTASITALSAPPTTADRKAMRARAADV